MDRLDARRLDAQRLGAVGPAESDLPPFDGDRPRVGSGGQRQAVAILLAARAACAARSRCTASAPGQRSASRRSWPTKLQSVNAGSGPCFRGGDAEGISGRGKAGPGARMAGTEIVEIENVWITVSDGCRIAARIWLPEGADAAP